MLCSADSTQSSTQQLTSSALEKRKRDSSPSLPIDIQEEIECLYEFVPDVDQHFKILNKIGEGTFSSVFLGKLKHYPNVDQLFALKHIIPTSHPSRIEGELRCLQEIGGEDNVMGVELCIRNRDHVVIVMPYFPHEKFKDYYLAISVGEVKEYMKNMLVALRRVHKFDMIHRDVKPSNFLYDKKTKQYALVDFGLAHKAPIIKKPHRHKPSEDHKENHNRKASSIISPSKKNILKETQNEVIVKKESPKKNKDCLKNEESCDKTNFKTPEVSVIKDSVSSTKDVVSRHLEVKRKQYTPSTPKLDNLAFSKKARSPRRYLLAKRALMAKEEQALTYKQKPKESLSTCQCYGQPVVCSICTSRGNQQAPRAGTPGFRSPEVLMKCPDQSTAVDMWSAGVIFLTLLSGRYPFFRADDDLTALAQIISIMGSEEVRESAQTYGKTLICSEKSPAIDLKMLCEKLRNPANKSSKSRKLSREADKANGWENVPDSAYDLLKRLLDLNPATRITAEDALEHDFFTS